MKEKERYKIILLKQINVIPVATKKESPEMLKQLMNSIAQNGQSVPVHVRINEQSGYELVSGRHIIRALTDLKICSAMCYNLGRISSAESKMTALKLNLIMFPWDEIGLSSLIHELGEHFTLHELYTEIPLSQKKIDALIQLKTFDWENESKQEHKKRMERAEKKKQKFLSDKIEKELKQGVHLYKRIGLNLFQ